MKRQRTQESPEEDADPPAGESRATTQEKQPASAPAKLSAAGRSGRAGPARPRGSAATGGVAAAADLGARTLEDRERGLADLGLGKELGKHRDRLEMDRLELEVQVLGVYTDDLCVA